MRSSIKLLISSLVCGLSIAALAWHLPEPGTQPVPACAWCARTHDLNVAHIAPQAQYPQLAHERTNTLILCRDCHFVLGHRCNWQTWNPDMPLIIRTYTNVLPILSATREKPKP